MLHGCRSCNPYGFLYPQDLHPPYTRRPASGIQDRDVTLADVAPQIQEHMFTPSLSTDTEGLLVSIEMKGEQPPGIVLDSAAWRPEMCLTAQGKPPRSLM